MGYVVSLKVTLLLSTEVFENLRVLDSMDANTCTSDADPQTVHSLTQLNQIMNLAPNNNI